MKTYRINYVATYTVTIEAPSDLDARVAADRIAESRRRDLRAANWKTKWNTIERQGGADD